MLKALEDFSPIAARVKTPRLYLFNHETNTQIMEDFPVTMDLKSLLVSSAASSILTQSVSRSIGRDIGSWLRLFHTWSSASAQAALREQIRGNESMRKLKYMITYNSFIKVLENFPEVLAGHKETLRKVEAMATEEFHNPAIAAVGIEYGIVHGDFWAGK